MSQNVVSLAKFRSDRSVKMEDQAYRAKVASMDKIALMEEMVRWQETRSAGDRSQLSVVRGRIIFDQLEKTCCTPEMKTLASSYKRQLESEFSRKKVGNHE